MLSVRRWFGAGVCRLRLSRLEVAHEVAGRVRFTSSGVVCLLPMLSRGAVFFLRDRFEAWLIPVPGGVRSVPLELPVGSAGSVDTVVVRI